MRNDGPIDTYLLLDRYTSEVFNRNGGCSGVWPGAAWTLKEGF
jgi:hypothetical protein